MANQEEQKQKTGAIARQRKLIASIPARFNSARTATETLPTETPEDGAEAQLIIQDSEKTYRRVVAHQIPDGPMVIDRRQMLISGLGAAATVLAMGTWLWIETNHQENTGTAPKAQKRGDQLVVLWNNTILQTIRKTRPSMPVAARALAIVHTCMYDAWAAYDPAALGTRLGDRLRQPIADQTKENKCKAISFAAFRALTDLFPSEQASFLQVMNGLHYNANERATNANTPAGVGNLAALAVLDFRHRDDSNQLGDLHPGAYSDYTKYRPVNTPHDLKSPNHWQPQLMTNDRGQLTSIAQQFENAQWANVTPFALTSTTGLLPKQGPARYPDQRYTEQAQEVLRYSAGLTDAQKASAEYWLSGPNMEQPASHWCLFAQFISQRDNHSLDQNVKLFFALTNAALDASIACWAVKRAYDSPYPITAIRYLFKDKRVTAWAGPGKGGLEINGVYWQPYRPASMLTPAFPEYCAENSAFSFAAAEILRNFTNSDHFGLSYTKPAHSSMIEPNNPVSNVTFNWKTLSQAAEESGLSGLYSGTHFPQSDLDGRLLGQKVGISVWITAQSYINGRR